MISRSGRGTGSPVGDRILQHLLIDRVRDYAIYLLDPDGIITSWNAGAQRFKGYTADEVIGQHFSRFYTEEDRAAGLPARALEIAERNGVFESEGWRVRKDGGRFWSSVVIDPIHDDDGTLVGFAKITRAITERRETQRSLAQARSALHRAQKTRAVVLLPGGCAHDFNNILQTIGNHSELAMRELATEPADAARHLGTARDAVERAARLTGRLLAFARKQPLEPARVDIHDLVTGMRHMLGQSLGKGIELEIRLAPDLWPAWIDAT